VPGLSEIFLRARRWSGPPDALEAALDEQCRAARAAWPDIALDPELFVAHLARHLPGDAGIGELRAARAADLWLARACADGDRDAIDALEARYFGEVDAAAARLRAGTEAAVEVKQLLRRILFVGEKAAIGAFAGRGDLRGWIRITAMRELQRLMIKEKREVKIDDPSFLDALSPANDPELGYLRDRYRAEVSEAVAAALRDAPSRDRALLRYAILDGLGIDELGKLYRVHRATAARWLAAARERLAESTRQSMIAQLQIPPSDYDSIVHLIRSQLDVSVARLLG
jgi:RNA polymerase sigma-70 factor (ECF subfamily)